MKRQYYVVYSPRGFANELTCVVFDDRKTVVDFSDHVDNGTNTFTLSTNQRRRRRMIDYYKKELREGQTDRTRTIDIRGTEYDVVDTITCLYDANKPY